MTLVRAVTAADFARRVTDAAHVYGLAMGRAPELVVQRREIMSAHLDRRGFVAVTAEDGERLVGFGYGYRGRRGEWWHDIVATALGEHAGTWLDDAFELAELHVLPDHQGQGLGRSVLTEVLARAGGATVVLSTHDTESPARNLYRSCGFVDLVTAFVFPGSSEVYAVMGLER